MQKSRRVVRRIISAVLVLMFIGAGSSTAYYLRQNNLQMLELREAVFVADKDNSDIASALSKLQLFVVSHMNTALPKLGDQKAIQLKYTYERLTTAEEARVSSARATLSAEATSHCQALHAGQSFAVRSQCVEDYYAAHPVDSVAIPKELYAFDFITPLWVADRAGISLLITAALFLVLLYRIVSYLIVRKSLRSTQ